jgi:hypothetical protein
VEIAFFKKQDSKKNFSRKKLSQSEKKSFFSETLNSKQKKKTIIVFFEFNFKNLKNKKMDFKTFHFLFDLKIF